MSRKKEVTVQEPIGMIMPGDEAEGEVLQDENPIKEVTEEKQEEAEAVVYLGPDIDKFLNHGTVFKGGILPAYLEEKAKEVPAIKGLIVPVSQYAEVALAVTMPTGRYNMLYNIVKNTVTKF